MKIKWIFKAKTRHGIYLIHNSPVFNLLTDRQRVNIQTRPPPPPPRKILDWKASLKPLEKLQKLQIYLSWSRWWPLKMLTSGGRFLLVHFSRISHYSAKQIDLFKIWRKLISGDQSNYLERLYYLPCVLSLTV